MIPSPAGRHSAVAMAMGASREPSKAYVAGDEARDEIGAIHKGWRGRFHIALIYPNTYAVGISNLGFQSVYARLNEIPQVVCERAFLPTWSQAESRTQRGRIRTVESSRPLSDFDVVAFSISFENDYPNILTILHSAGLPLLSEHRAAPHPLVLGGGVACFLNPEPIAPFFDLFLLGEAEALLPSFLTVLTDGHAGVHHSSREVFLRRIAEEVPGAYVPNLYKEAYGSDGTLASFLPEPGVPAMVSRVFAADIDRFDTCSTIITPHGSFDSDILVEVGRGCPHGCRFCSAGYIYRPPRFRSAERLSNTLRSVGSKGKRVGLVGAAVSDLPFLYDLCREAEALGIKLGFSSLRAEQLSPGLISMLAAGGVKTATLAPDGGSEHMRRRINKGITEKDILDAVKGLVEAGIPNVKLYFMVGLPEETTSDIDAVSDLVKRVKAVFLAESRSRNRIGTISVSINGFVPKPMTPFQWAAMDPPAILRGKIARIRKELATLPNVHVKAESPKSSFLQAIFSRGDRRVAELLLAGFSNGWNWPKTLRSWYMDPSFFGTRRRYFEEILPWDFIDSGIRKRFLWAEYMKALQDQPSKSCPMVPCTECRACRYGD